MHVARSYIPARQTLTAEIAGTAIMVLHTLTSMCRVETRLGGVGLGEGV